MSQEKEFDINGVGICNGNLFGLPHTIEEAEIIILPIPWDVTTSYKPGTSRGPQAILEASTQLDLFDKDFKDTWERGIFMSPIDQELLEQNDRLRQKASAYIETLESGEDIADQELESLLGINESCKSLQRYIYEYANELIKSGKKVALLGGDHSSPLGFIKALSEHHDSFGILQIDAHMDLREAYEGFTYSHASIMCNILAEINVSKLVQVGIRDYCEEEYTMMQKSKGKIKTFFDRDIKQSLFDGASWKSICKSIVEALPNKVYISYDIDGLNPSLCPDTGTPVPGGLEFEQVNYLLHSIKESGKQIIGFDLCEVAPNSKTDWNENVGARVLYELCKLMS